MLSTPCSVTTRPVSGRMASGFLCGLNRAWHLQSWNKFTDPSDNNQGYLKSKISFWLSSVGSEFHFRITDNFAAFIRHSTDTWKSSVTLHILHQCMPALIFSCSPPLCPDIFCVGWVLNNQCRNCPLLEKGMGKVHAQRQRWWQTPVVHISTMADLVSGEAHQGWVLLGFLLVHVRITASDSAHRRSHNGSCHFSCHFRFSPGTFWTQDQKSLQLELKRKCLQPKKKYFYKTLL